MQIPVPVTECSDEHLSSAKLQHPFRMSSRSSSGPSAGYGRGQALPFTFGAGQTLYPILDDDVGMMTQAPRRGLRTFVSDIG